MKPASSTTDGLLAVVESTSPLDVVLAAIPQTEPHLAVTVTPADRSPNGFTWYEVRSTNDNRISAMASIRQALTSLISAAERGEVAEFRVVHGAAFIAACEHQTTPGAGRHFDQFGLPA